jgi:ABC-2 type transport system ATP-binding protein
MTLAIETKNLSKTYSTLLGKQRITALDGIDLTVARGEVFGLLGANGAGKTTTVKILLDLTRPTAGSATILGIPVSEPSARRKVGYLPEGHRFPGYLTARETLSIFGRMSSMESKEIASRGMELLTRLRIAQFADLKVRKFSKGMTQRLGLAAALLDNPDVLLLDEPTDGVDPVGRREIRDLLREEAANGKTIFLNSHLLSEIELMCDRVAILRKGKIAAMGRIDELTHQSSLYKLKGSPIGEDLLGGLRQRGASVERSNGHVVLGVRDLQHLNAMIDEMRSAGVLLSEVTPVRETLEDVFVDLVRAEGTGGDVQ